VGYLTGRLNLSHRDVVEVLGALHGVEIGLGSVAALQKQVSEALAGVVETARQFVKQQAVHYVDETSWLERARMRWLWVNATTSVTSFRILPGRGRGQAEEVIGRPAKGIFTTDRYNAYHWLGVRKRQICWAHLKREQLGRELLEKTRELFVIWRQFQNGNLTRRQFQIQMRPVKAEFGKLLRQGARSEDSKTGACCRQILQWEKSLWSYVHTPGAEPTNNLAERSLRRGVLWRKKSFGTQSEEGTRFVERVLTVVTTLRQQKRDVMDFLTTACQNRAGLTQPLCLLPETSSM
jgi:transposase